MVNRFGKVDDGRRHDRLRRRGDRAQAHLVVERGLREWNKQKINLIDTPGMGNFLSEARAALHVADAALVVVDCGRRRDGPDRKGLAGGGRAVAAADGRAQPIDRERASLDRSLTLAARAVQPRGDSHPAADRRREDLQGVVDLITKKAFVFPADESGKFTEGAVPADMTAAVDSAREALIEMVARTTRS
jgi:elongation factor G